MALPPRYRPELVHRQILPAPYVAALERLLSALPPTLPVALASDTTVSVPAGRAWGLVIDGAWRWVEDDDGPITRADPGGAAGTHYLWAVASANSFSAGAPEVGEVDETFYGFELRITTSAAAPTGTLAGAQAIAHTQLLRTLTWSGTKITAVVPISPEVTTLQRLVVQESLVAPSLETPGGTDYLLENDPRLPPIGQISPYSGTGDPNASWLVCDGRLVNIASYPALDALIGNAAAGSYHYKYSAGSSPGAGKLALPDIRGRTVFGLINPGTAGGAGPNANARAQVIVAQVGGESRHLLVLGEIPSHSHAKGTLTIAMDPVTGHVHTFGNGSATLLAGPTALAAGGGGGTISNGSNVTQTDPAGAHTPTGAVNGSTATAGTGGDHENMPPFAAENWIIRVL